MVLALVVLIVEVPSAVPALGARTAAVVSAARTAVPVAVAAARIAVAHTEEVLIAAVHTVAVHADSADIVKS